VLQDHRENRKRELISQEAAEWFARMQDPRVPLDDRRSFLRWLKQSPIHVAEYLAVTGIDGDLRRAHLTAVLDDASGSNVVALYESRDRPAPRWRVLVAIVCGLALLLLVVARFAWFERSISTEAGEWKPVTLADGSELQLGPNTTVQIDLDSARRSIALVRGEAYFKVAPDPRRPFFVNANAFAVRAVGTEFAVARRNSELIVTVAEGAVRVAPSTASSQSPRAIGSIAAELGVPLAADQQLRIADTWPATPDHVDVRYELAWRERRLMFRSGDTLTKAVKEFNLRNRVQLRLDPAVESLPVRGSFDAADPVAFAQTMDGTSPVAVQRLAPELLLIKPE
jgi:transmembrane sensor